MLRKALSYCILLMLVFAVVGISAREVCAQEIKVRVIQVRASNTGKEEVDPSLGALGERIKRRYPYRNYKRVDTSYRSGGAGDTILFPLTGGLSLTLVLKGYQDPMVEMQATVRRAGAPILNTNLRVKAGRTMIISVPLARDTLILAITPYVK